MAIGLYIHVPFCVTKCPYCDFYSLPNRTDSPQANEERMDAYTHAVLHSLEQWKELLPDQQADTLYFGGGTPSLLGGNRIRDIIKTARRCFGLDQAEITMEANPADNLQEVFNAFASVGGNRVSLGMQSANQKELHLLGRRHQPADVEMAVRAAHSSGIQNISLDIMLGTQSQSIASVIQSAKTAAGWGAKHISAYLLKIEEGTPFFRNRDTMNLPDEDTSAEMYLSFCETMDTLGYQQYEISNFAFPGFESRHNQKYWNMQPYLGIGPSAHSFLGGHRFYYPRDFDAFLNDTPPIKERSQQEEMAPHAIREASEAEYILLRLRLAQGITEEDFFQQFGYFLPEKYRKRASVLPSPLIVTDDKGIHLTRTGFLLSNTIISRLLDDF